MNEHINLVEKLKDCPKGTPLYSPMFGEVRFYGITDSEATPIEVTLVDMVHHDEEELIHAFTADGRHDAEFPNAECMLFTSSENRDWSTFVVPKSLPKTWMEFCQMHDVQPDEAYINNESSVSVNEREGIRLSIDDRNLLPNKKTAYAMLALCQLVQLRDCYNGDWKADYNDPNQTRFCIYLRNNEILYTYFVYDDRANDNHVLTFKTGDLAAQFLYNFKYLIVQAASLL